MYFICAVVQYLGKKLFQSLIITFGKNYMTNYKAISIPRDISWPYLDQNLASSAELAEF